MTKQQADGVSELMRQEPTELEIDMASRVLRSGEKCGDDLHTIAKVVVDVLRPYHPAVAENERLREALKQIAETPNAGWMIARAALSRSERKDGDDAA